MLRNDRPNNRSIEKRPSMISCKEQCLSLHWNTLSTLKRMPVSCGMLLETLLRLNRLDFNGYLDTRANHPYKMQTKSDKVLTPLSTSSLWKSSKTGTIYQTTSLPMKSDCPIFWVCKMGIFFNHRRITRTSIGWVTWGVGSFSPKKTLKS